MLEAPKGEEKKKNDDKEKPNGVDDSSDRSPALLKLNPSWQSDTQSYSDTSLKEIIVSSEEQEPPLTKIIAAVILFLALVFTTTSGAALFVYVESSVHSDKDLPFTKCLNSVEEEMKKLMADRSNSIEDPIKMSMDKAKDCFARNSRISDIGIGAVYSCSLFTTIGYGNYFPHTIAGQWVTLVYAFFIVPLYIAYKAEFGQYVAKWVYKLAKCCKHFLVVRPLSRKPSDLLVVFTTFVLGAVLALLMTGVVTLSEDWNFTQSFYYTFITAQLIGLGDVTTSNEVVFLFCIFPFIVIVDIFGSYINYYMHGRYRVAAHRLARFICCFVEIKRLKDEETSSESTEDTAPRIFPSITAKSMPMNVMDCDRKTVEQDAELLSLPTISRKVSRQDSKEKKRTIAVKGLDIEEEQSPLV